MKDEFPWCSDTQGPMEETAGWAQCRHSQGACSLGNHQEIPHSLHTAVPVSTAAFPVGLWVTATCHPTEGGPESEYKPQTPSCPGATHTHMYTRLPDALKDTVLGTVTKQQLGCPYSLCPRVGGPGAFSELTLGGPQTLPECIPHGGSKTNPRTHKGTEEWSEVSTVRHKKQQQRGN